MLGNNTLSSLPDLRGNLTAFQRLYRREDEPKSIKTRVKEEFRKICSRRWMLDCAKRHCQIWNTLRTYKLRQDFPCDVLAGISVGIMHIPQSMAYSLLATLPPISGLYTALFAPIVYLFLGTSKHLSMGAITVVSLMMAAVLDRKLDIEGGVTPTSTGNGNGTSKSLEEQKLEIAVALSFVSGAIMMALGKIGLGVITTYMSEPLINAFTSGVAVHVLVSQLKNVLGLKIRRYNGVLKIFKTLYEVFKNIEKTNVADLVTALVCVAVLLVVKTQINDRFRRRLPIPVPVELVVIILGTVLSYFLLLESSYGVHVVGDIPAGLPSPRVPNLSVVTDCIPDAVLIGVVAFGQSVSMAKIMARRHSYKIQPNQEMVAYGAGSMVCAIFTGYITAGSVARSLVQDTAGGRTQIASVFSCIVVFVVIMAVGPLFYSLPQSVLSSVILVALRSMFLQVRETKTLWKTSKYDLSVWLVTYGSVVILDADIGLAIGIAFSLLTVVIRTQRTSPLATGRVADTNIYKTQKLYKEVQEIPGVKIVSYNAPIYFANVDYFIEDLYKCLEMDIEKAKRHKHKRRLQLCPDTGCLSALRRSDKNVNDSSKDNQAYVADGVSTEDTDAQAVSKPTTEPPCVDVSAYPKAGGQNARPSVVTIDTSVGDECNIQQIPTLSERIETHPEQTPSLPEPTPATRQPKSTPPESKLRLPETILPPPKSTPFPNFHGSILYGIVQPPTHWDLQSSPSVSSLGSSVSDESSVSIDTNYLILDLSKVNFVDTVGVNMIKELIEDCEAVGTEVLLAECNDDVLLVLQSSAVWDMMAKRLFVTVHDAEMRLLKGFSTDDQSPNAGIPRRTYL